MVDNGKKMVILCVDDDQAVLLSLKSQLKSHYKDKFQYEMAYNADEAFEIIKNLPKKDSQIVLIISDWLMQGMKGDEFLIRVHQLYPSISTVLLTGHAPDEAIEKARKNANLLTCLNKPWSVDDLINVIQLASKDHSHGAKKY